VKATYPYYVIRLSGGLLVFSGMLVMLWNVLKTIGAGKAVEATIPPVSAGSGFDAPAHA
jgi:cytochrome c oxidase cbb3-type subunit 1